ncbi:MAG: MFS transporter [Candidatus Saccharibacteria bacterium]
MFKSFLYRILERRHFWRYASFSEIAELYMSRTIRVIAMSIVSGFTSVYMYSNGYSLTFIMILFLGYYLLKVPLSIFSGKFITKHGPKHGILISNLLYAPAMVALGFIPIIGTISIIIWAFFMAISASLYHISYMVDFSKVKNVEHAGKELAFMNILEKVAIGLSPLIGGVIALYFGLQMVIWLSAGLFIISALPLFKSAEPTNLHQKIKWSGFPWLATIRSIIANTGVGFDYVTTGIAWHLFIVIVIFPKSGWEIYVKLGALSSVTILAAVVASYVYGKLIDNSKGGSLLKISVVANALVHVLRPFANTPAAIVGTNIANETATMGYNMAFMRGLFDTADLSGHRILYLCICDAVANLGAALACLILAILTFSIGEVSGLNVFFFIAAGFVLLIGSAKFNIYHK